MGFRPVIEMRLEGADELMRKLEHLDDALHRQVIGKAGRFALAGVRRVGRDRMAALPFKPSGKGAMGVRATLVRNTRTKTNNRTRGQTVVSVRVEYRAAGSNRLAHLFEWGFRHVGGKVMPAYLMMTTALDSQRAAIMRRFATKAGSLLKGFKAP